LGWGAVLTGITAGVALYDNKKKKEKAAKEKEAETEK
jgi:hypothetical protein